MFDFLIIGAGIAGLNAANKLSATHKAILVLEKSRGLGGRAATRRLENNRVDHGTQYFTVRDERFQRQVNEWLTQKKAFVWSYGFPSMTSEGLKPASKGHPRYAFRNGMNEMGKLLSKDLNVKTETRVKSIQPAGSTWLVIAENEETFEARKIIVNTPAEQALALLAFEAPGLRQTLEQVKLSPCFALMLGYPKELTPNWQGLNIETIGPLAWIAHDSSKRQNPSYTLLTLHSTPQFAQHHFDDDPKDLAQIMLSELIRLDERFATPLFQSWHRWKYAQVINPIKEHFINYNNSLFFCGDWCGGEKLESAYLSGLELADYLTQN